MTLKRSDIKLEDTWDLTVLFKNAVDWEKALEDFVKNQLPTWSKYSKKDVTNDPTQIKILLDCQDEIARSLSKLYAYAHHEFDSEMTNDDSKGRLQKVTQIYAQFSQITAWFEPTLLTLDENILNSFSKDKILKEYHFYIQSLLNLKKHVLSDEKEALIAQASLALSTPQKAFSALNNADFKFGSVVDSKGEEKEITHGNYQLYIYSTDRTLRKNTFTKYHKTYLGFENSISELLVGHIHTHNLNATIRGYKNCLEAALLPKNVDLEVYHNLIKTVKGHLKDLHTYFELRKKILNVSSLHLYDMYAPLKEMSEKEISYQDAVKWVVESVKPLGQDYQEKLKKGLSSDRWVDRYESLAKRSGAYSGGCYDSYPYILLNFKGTMRDVFTLAHEAGHSMHSQLSREHQPHQTHHYPVFVAEVASTFNEELLFRYLLDNISSEDEKFFLIAQKIDDIRGTLFRQTMFAEFELLIHTFIEKNRPITPTILKEEYLRLNQEYFGKNVIVDNEVSIEWARIPHFYSNFYVYQYATGISAALALSDDVLKGNKTSLANYLKFLKTGGSQYPVDLLKIAGVDMTQSSVIVKTLGIFKNLVKLLEKMQK